MTSSEERLQILRMIAGGQITAEEGEQLLAALDAQQQEPPESAARWINIRISDERSGRQRVNVNVPVGLLSVGMQLGARLGTVNGVDVDALLGRIRSGSQGKLLDIQGDDGERVEISVE
jgi:DUF4097 and DUF4098 domain-containing protein YvlB